MVVKLYQKPRYSLEQRGKYDFDNHTYLKLYKKFKKMAEKYS